MRHFRFGEKSSSCKILIIRMSLDIMTTGRNQSCLSDSEPLTTSLGQDGADIWLAMEIAPGGDLDGKFKDAMKTGTLIKEDLLGTWAAGTVYGECRLAASIL